MPTKEILKNILRYGNYKLDDSSFDPLLSLKTARKVSESLCKGLADTSNNENSKLKNRIRKNIIDLVQQVTTAGKPLQNAETRSDILVKHLYVFKYQRDDNKNKKYIRKIHKPSDLDLWSLYDNVIDENVHSIENTNLQLGMALLNIEGPNCKVALNDIVNKCLNKLGKIDESSYEFLMNVWEHEKFILDLDLYEKLSFRLVSFIEIKLLDLNTELLQYNSQSLNDDRIRTSFNNYFPNKDYIFSTIAKSQNLFKIFFKILTDILIISKFDDNVQKVILFIRDEVKNESKTGIIYHLYPSNLNNIVILLDDEPNKIFGIPKLYDYVLTSIDNLFECSEFEFVFVMSHYPLWLKQYIIYLESNINNL